MAEYPKDREAPRAAYYIGIAYETNKQYAEAKTAYESALKQFPKSRAARLLKEHLETVNRKLKSSR